MLPDIQNAVNQSLDNTIQSTGKSGYSNTYGVSWLAKAGLLVSNWWSEKRDKELRNFWKKSDHLSGAIYNMTSKMTAIPFTIIAKDSSNKDHVLQAEELTSMMRASAQFGEGWPVFFSRFVEDLLTQDNGSFAEIIGPGDPAGPIIGQPIAFAHLDAARCQRTADPLYPVLYRDDDNKLYKLHYTRVMFTSQMTSPVKEMNGVGFCSVSRCINVAQTLIDILTFKQEKLGSRPHRAIIITSGGLDPKDVADAFQMAESSMDSQNLSRYSKVVIAGSSAIEDAKIDITELSELPDGFDERTSVELGMATIALALGMDARELFPGMTSGATRADALVQHLKQRGKGPGQILEIVESMFNYKYLPQHLKMLFDYQDDAQDRQAAETRKIRAERANIELINGVIQRRTMREQMLYAGDIDQGQFEMMELLDGRLDDGTDILSVFYRPIKALDKYMDLGAEDPLDWAKNDPEACYLKAHENLQLLRKEVETMKKGSRVWAFRGDAMKIMAALMKIKQVYAHILNSAAEEPIDKIMAADEAISMLTDDPELGQKNIENPASPFNLMTQMAVVGAQQGPINQPPGKTGPNPNNPRAGRAFNKMDPTAPNGNAQMDPRDVTKPRKADQDPTAKQIDDDYSDAPDPF